MGMCDVLSPCKIMLFSVGLSFSFWGLKLNEAEENAKLTGIL